MTLEIMNVKLNLKNPSKMSRLKYFSLLGISLSFLVSCKNNVEKGTAPIARKVVSKIAITKDQSNEITKLSEYPFFEGKIADLKPAENVYELSLIHI